MVHQTEQTKLHQLVAEQDKVVITLLVFLLMFLVDLVVEVVEFMMVILEEQWCWFSRWWS